jgi:sortase A
VSAQVDTPVRVDPNPSADVGRTLVLRLPSRRTLAGWLLAATGAVVLGLLVVQFLLGAVLQSRSQHDLLHRFQSELRAAAERAGATRGLAQRRADCAQLVSGCAGNIAQPQTPSPDDLSLVAPLPGRPVALLQIPRLHLSQVIVEGDRAQQTELGPGHVTGTVLPGQAGNAGIVGRRTTWGAVFRSLGSLRVGDEIGVVTFQGRSTYRVSHEGHVGKSDPFSGTGPDRLTLVTSDPPIVADGAIVVSATLASEPHAPTPQGARDLGDDGLHARADAVPILVLMLLLLGLVSLAARAAFRRLRPATAYLVSAPPLLAMLLLLGEVAGRLLPPAI